MDQDDAKREARRRRILENSQQRLFKITGRNGHTDVEVNSSCRTFVSGGEYDPSLEPNINGIADISSQRSNAENGFSSDDIWNDIPTALNYNCNDGVGNDHGTPSKGSNIEKLYNSYGEVHNRLSETIVKDPSASVKSVFLSHTILTNRINYVLLAAIVNVMLILRLDYLFGKAITIPYFIMMLGRLCAFDATQTTQSSGLFFAALVLCNIDTGLTHKLKRLVRVLGIIVGDLALYVFSFTLMYYAISYCLGDIETAVNL